MDNYKILVIMIRILSDSDVLTNVLTGARLKMDDGEEQSENLEVVIPHDAKFSGIFLILFDLFEIPESIQPKHGVY